MEKHSSLIRRLRTLVVHAVILSLVVSSAGSPLVAQVRRAASYSTFINPAPTPVVRGTFVRGGLFAIAGGVVLHGKAQFLIESATAKQTVAGATVRLAYENPGAVYLTQGGNRYSLDMHRGLACPLGRFVQRGGEIAYTIPEDESPAGSARLTKRGLVETGPGEWIAKEFANGMFASLMEAADFADVDPLPETLAANLVTSVNTYVSPAERTEVEGGSYINSDAQVTYRVFLMEGKNRVEISGVPLRYYWRQAADGSAIVRRIAALSQDWPANTRLTTFSRASAEPTQYDIVSFYQTAAVFRQLNAAAPGDFKLFVTSACAN
jgi:hypothetical protein